MRVTARRLGGWPWRLGRSCVWLMLTRSCVACWLPPHVVLADCGEAMHRSTAVILHGLTCVSEVRQGSLVAGKDRRSKLSSRSRSFHWCAGLCSTTYSGCLDINFHNHLARRETASSLATVATDRVQLMQNATRSTGMVIPGRVTVPGLTDWTSNSKSRRRYSS
jgi:hypothetical protein